MWKQQWDQINETKMWIDLTIILVYLFVHTFHLHLINLQKNPRNVENFPRIVP